MQKWSSLPYFKAIASPARNLRKDMAVVKNWRHLLHLDPHTVSESFRKLYTTQLYTQSGAKSLVQTGEQLCRCFLGSQFLICSLTGLSWNGHQQFQRNGLQWRKKGSRVEWKMSVFTQFQVEIYHTNSWKHEEIERRKGVRKHSL